jgi:hypothetical protein
VPDSSFLFGSAGSCYLFIYGIINAVRSWGSSVSMVSDYGLDDLAMEALGGRGGIAPTHS